MRKFKLIKCYPGSGNLGDIAKLYENHHYVVPHPKGKKYCDGLAIPKYHVEDNPEYWEEIAHIYYMVSLIDMGFHNAWEPIRAEAIKYDTDTKKYFSAKEDAIDFILLHKPCLSYNDVKEEMRCQVSQQGILQSIYHIVKSRI